MASFEEAADWIGSVADGIEQGGISAMMWGQQLILDVARDMSMGPFSRRTIDEMYTSDDSGRRYGPYSRAMPHPPEDPAYINVGSGNLLGDWQDPPPVPHEDGYLAKVNNVARHARFLWDEEHSQQSDHGTRVAIGRPLPEAVIEAVTTPIVLHTQDAIRTTVPSG